MGHHWTPSGGDHGLRSTNVHMSTTQIGLLQSVYRTRKKLTRRGLAFWLLQQNGQGQISLCIQHQLHHKEHMNACSATISVSGTCGLSEDHVDACSATISVSGTRGQAEDHVQSCSATISVSGPRGGLRIMCMHAAPPFPFPEHVGWLNDHVGACSATSSISGTCSVLVRLLVGKVFLVSAEPIVVPIVA